MKRRLDAAIWRAELAATTSNCINPVVPIQPYQRSEMVEAPG